MSISMSRQKSAGIYNAKKIIRIFHGNTPRSLEQVYENIPYLAVNLKTAELIGYHVPMDILSIADEVYTDFGNEDE